MPDNVPPGPLSPRYRPLTVMLPRFAVEGGLSGFVVMGFILIVSPAGAQSTRLGRLILLGGSTGLGITAGALLALLYWWWGRAAYKKAGGPMASSPDERD